MGGTCRTCYTVTNVGEDGYCSDACREYEDRMFAIELRDERNREWNDDVWYEHYEASDEDDD